MHLMMKTSHVRIRLSAGDIPPRSQLVETFFAVAHPDKQQPKLDANTTPTRAQHGDVESLRLKVRTVREALRDEKADLRVLRERIDHVNQSLNSATRQSAEAAKSWRCEIEKWYAGELLRIKKETAATRRQRPAQRLQASRSRLKKNDAEELESRVAALHESNASTEKRDRCNELRLNDCIRQNNKRLTELRVLLDIQSQHSSLRRRKAPETSLETAARDHATSSRTAPQREGAQGCSAPVLMSPTKRNAAASVHDTVVEAQRYPRGHVVMATTT